MAFHFSRRKLRPAEHAEGTELNIVPYLDILMNLIMFMLLSITGLSALGILNVNAPNYGAAAAQQEQAEQPKLLLSVLIQKKGFYVAGAGAVLGQQNPTGQQTAATTSEPTIPKRADGTYDYQALTTEMMSIKKDFPSETKVILGAKGTIPYETLVQTMDSVREAPNKQLLFPDVTLATM